MATSNSTVSPSSEKQPIKGAFPLDTIDALNDRLRWAGGACAMLSCDAKLNNDYTNVASSADNHIREAQKLVSELCNALRNAKSGGGES